MNSPKEVYVGDLAENFRAAGFAVLTYDPRSYGESEGTPRREINPTKQIQDLHDALTFLKAHPLVDPTRIALWGYSLSGTVALCAAALDKRVRAVVSVCPTTIWEFSKMRKFAAKAMQDRESQLAGNEPVYVPMILENDESPVGWGNVMPGSHARLSKGEEVYPTFRLAMTLSSFYHIACFRPFHLMPYVSPTPVLLVSAEKDTLASPEVQRELFDNVFQEPKQLLVCKNRSHWDILSGEGSDELVRAQIAFLRDAMGLVVAPPVLTEEDREVLEKKMNFVNDAVLKHL